MQGIKSKITKLKARWEEKIQETNDIFGYHGISKENVQKSLEESYNLLSGLEQHEGNFEVVLLKRNLRVHLDIAKWYMKDGIDESDHKDKFNDFLNAVFQIRSLIKQTYLIVQDKAIRTESEIHALKESKEELDKLVEEYNDSIKSIKEQYENVNSMMGQTEKNVQDIKAQHDSVTEQAKNIIARGEKIDSIYNKIEGWDEDVLTRQQTIKTVASDIKAKQDLINNQLSAIETLNQKLKDNQTELEKQLNESEENLKRATDVLGKSNEAGMAGSFKKRKDELFCPLVMWAVVFVGSIFGLLYFSSSLLREFLEIVKGENQSLRELILHLGFVSPFVWLGWMSAKQYGYISRIWEDYSFKYAISMAFEGYRSVTKDIVSDEMKEELLQLTVKNISDNPIRLYDSKSNHGTPLNEILKEGKDLFISGKRSLWGWIPTIEIKSTNIKDGENSEEPKAKA